MGISMLSPAFLVNWLNDNIVDDIWIAPQAPDINWDDNLSEIDDLTYDDWLDYNWTDADWIINIIDA
jgi:hypothetical protein